MSQEDKSQYQRKLFIAIAIISLGITFTTVFESLKPIGIIMVGIGGLFMIMIIKRKDDDKKNRK